MTGVYVFVLVSVSLRSCQPSHWLCLPPTEALTQAHMWKALIGDYRTQDVAALAFRDKIEACQRSLQEAPTIETFQTLAQEMPRWLEGLKPRFVQPLLSEVEKAGRRLLQESQDQSSFLGLAALTEGDRKALAGRLQEVADIFVKLNMMLLGKHPGIVVVKSEAAKMASAVTKNMKAREAVDCMKQVIEKGHDLATLFADKALHASFFELFSSGGDESKESRDEISGLEQEECQRTMELCWATVCVAIMKWAADNEDVEDTAMISRFNCAGKRMHQLMASVSSVRELLLPVLDVSSQMRAQLMTSIEMFSSQTDVHLQFMQLKSFLVRLVDARQKVTKVDSSADLSEEDEFFLQKMDSYAETLEVEATAFLKQVKDVLMQKEKEAMKASVADAQRLVGTASTPVWRRPPSTKQSVSPPDMTFDDLCKLAASSVLKGDYASKVSECLKKLEQAVWGSAA